MVVLPAFGGTSGAGLSAQGTGLSVQVTAAHEQAGGGGADVGTVPIQPNAYPHHVDIGFVKARSGAGLTGIQAGQAGVDTRMDLLFIHMSPWHGSQAGV